MGLKPEGLFHNKGNNRVKSQSANWQKIFTKDIPYKGGINIQNI